MYFIKMIIKNNGTILPVDTEEMIRLYNNFSSFLAGSGGLEQKLAFFSFWKVQGSECQAVQDIHAVTTTQFCPKSAFAPGKQPQTTVSKCRIVPCMMRTHVSVCIMYPLVHPGHITYHGV